MRIRMTVMAALATLAGSVGLYPLFMGGQWFFHALGAVVAAAVGAVAVRRLRVPAVFDPLGPALALLLYCTLVFAPGTALLGFLPTPSSLRALGQLVQDGWSAANKYAAPVPDGRGLHLLVTIGVGAVATIVDLLAVRLRRAAPAGLPLLAMYSVPAAIREHGVNWIAFGLGAAGYLALLMTDARESVGGWGRMVFSPRWHEETPAERERPDVTALASSGRRIGLAAVAVAVLLPMAVPGIHPRGVFGGKGSGGTGEGTRTVTTPDPMVSLSKQLTNPDDGVVLTYRSDDTDRPDYLRLYALDKFDGDRWTYSVPSTAKDRLTDAPLPAPPGLTVVATRTVNTRIRFSKDLRDLQFLPLPYAPVQVRIKGDWRVHAPSLMVYSLRDGAGGRTVDVTSRRVLPTASDLAAGGSYTDDQLTEFASVPKTVPRKVHDLAVEVTKGSRNAYESAVKLQTWFTDTGGFRYDLSVGTPEHGSDLLHFLTDRKRGYCEQFAAAMAVMARELGIPARVSVGYTPGREIRPGEWEVRGRDAHAWPELYFDGAGWVRFEPTPTGDPGQGTANEPGYSVPPGGPGSNGNGASSPLPQSSSSAGPNARTTSGPRHRNDLPGVGGTPTPSAKKHHGGPGYAPWIAGGVLVLLLLAAAPAVRILTRRRRWSTALEPPPGPETSRPGGPRGPRPRPKGQSDAAHAAWRELRADAIDHGVSWPSSETPRATARRLDDLLALDDTAAGALRRIARAEELARYAPSDRTPPSADVLRADVRTMRSAFASSATTTTRWRARLLPASTVAEARDAARAAGERTARATGRAEHALSRVLARLRALLPTKPH
ncbi:transglutaminaseTgpA domain-containing protein [Actinomadura gamaensis]|uniref:TransglutaminaseTgpA domain-containing protein n=1 Tax=Actinomadura gamaensis TaxID=1763541 RepID=A0ABV9TUX7_9ACTN